MGRVHMGRGWDNWGAKAEPPSAACTVCAGTGTLARNEVPLQEGPRKLRACATRGAHGVAGSRQCGRCAMPGACPCQLLLEQPVEGLAFPLVWQRCCRLYSADCSTDFV